MKAVFVELPAFERHRTDCLDDDEFRSLQNLLMLHPEAGDLIPAQAAFASFVLLTRDAARVNVAVCE